MNYLQAIGIQQWRVRGSVVLKDIVEPKAVVSVQPAEKQNKAQDPDPNTPPQEVALAQDSAKIQADTGAIQGASPAEQLTSEASPGRLSESLREPSKPLKPRNANDDNAAVMPTLRPAPVPLEVASTTDLTIETVPTSPTVEVESGYAQTPMPAPLIDYLDEDIPAERADHSDDVVEALQSDEENLSKAPDLGEISAFDWRALQTIINDDQHCPSCGQGRSVLGFGDALADWVFISDAPTSNELMAQKIHVERAGQLYEAILSACGLNREAVYTTTVFKCVPPEDLSLSPVCEKLIHRQLTLIQPKVVVTFGEFSTQAVLKSNYSLTELMQQQHHYAIVGTSPCRVIPSESPQKILSDPTLKATLWQSLKQVLTES